MPQRNKRKKKDDVGPGSAGQSGDLQQLPDAADADSESVEELVEEGNASRRAWCRASKMLSRPMFRESKRAKYQKMMYRQST